MESSPPPALSARRLFTPGSFEESPRFRGALTRAAQTGLQWGGAVGIVGVVLLVGVYAGLLGRPVSWWYPSPLSATAFVLWDKAVVGAACFAAIALGRHGCSLAVGRWGAAALGVTIAAVSLIHDAYRGILSPEYVLLAYLLTVTVVPYRPWQALLLGMGMTLLLYGVGTLGLPGTPAAAPALVHPGHVVRMSFATILLTGAATVLYLTRLRQHRSQERAERLREQVEALERAKSAFFVDLSHAFRTPLTLLRGATHALASDRFGSFPEAVQERVTVARTQVDKLERLVNQLLELAALDEGKLTLTVQRHDLAALATRCGRTFGAWAEAEGLDLQMEIPDTPVPAWVDAERMEQVIDNLLSNAIKYTPAPGTVRLQVVAREEVVRLSVRDTGPGLPDGLTDRLFGRFDSHLPVHEQTARTEDGHTPAETAWIGMGIGLAHTRAMVEQHGGTLKVESESGFGTEITVCLSTGREHLDADVVADAPSSEAPSGDAGSSASAPDRAPAVLPPAVKPPPPEAISGADLEGEESGAEAGNESDAHPPEDLPRILVVDDEPEMRRFLASMLGDAYRVTTVPNGDVALDRLREERFDLLMSDVVMPGRDGVALCRAVRNDEALRPLPILLLTARRDDETRLRALEARADAYVSKPFSPPELRARVENLIEIRRLVADRVRLPGWTKPTAPSVSPEQASFLEEVTAVIDAHIDNSNFGVSWLADELDLSARQLRRRLKDVTRLSPSGFIRARRLQHAATLLAESDPSVADVADAVGYRDPSYFSRLFRETFGHPPSEHAETAEKSDTSP